MFKKTLPDPEIMYRAIINKDSNFEGIFFFGVKTTGVFCRPGCTARKPNQENIEYFGSTREALLEGYRPCRICHPLGEKGAFPAWLQPLMAEINQNPMMRLKNFDLKKRGLDSNRLRRWFKKHHGMTFQAYLRALRIGQAFGRIQYGEKVIEAAFESGYESLSGFTDSFKKQLGFSPNQSADRKLITVTRIATPIGPMLAGATSEGVCLLEFVDRRMLETQIKRLKQLLNAELLPGTNPHFDLLNIQLKEYFQGTRQEFSVQLVLPGTDFQKQVWALLQKIPYGLTRSYKKQAEMLGKPGAVRAVGKANGDNRISIIIPCHRVIGEDGKLVGYGGGIWRKQYLLELEARSCK